MSGIERGRQPPGLGHQVRDRQREVHARRAQRPQGAAQGPGRRRRHGRRDPRPHRQPGHVDRTSGSREERAFAVKKWLEDQSNANFPAGRTQGVRPRLDRAGRAELHLGGTGQEPARRDRAGHRRANLDVHSSHPRPRRLPQRASEPAPASGEPGRLARIFLPNRAVDRATRHRPGRAVGGGGVRRLAGVPVGEPARAGRGLARVRLAVVGRAAWGRRCSRPSS